MSRTATKRKKANGQAMTIVFQVPLNTELKDKLHQMSFIDRRRPTEFMRILLEDEWNRRQKIAQQNEAT